MYIYIYLWFLFPKQILLEADRLCVVYRGTLMEPTFLFLL